jgi:hypothetical protein
MALKGYACSLSLTGKIAINRSTLTRVNRSTEIGVPERNAIFLERRWYKRRSFLRLQREGVGFAPPLRLALRVSMCFLEVFNEK